MSLSLDEAAQPRADGATLRLDVPAGWRQGRGAFGGVTVGASVRAIEQRVADPRRRVRSVTAELMAPVEAGPAELAVDVLRGGSSVTVARAALLQAGETRVHAVAVLAAARPAAADLAWCDLVAPVSPPWREIAPLPMPRGVAPEFTQHFEYRLVEGTMGAGVATGAARVVGWVRPSAPSRLRDAGYIAALADAWYPAVFVRWRAMRPIGTIAYTLDIVGDLAGLDPDAPLLYRGTVPVCGDGYFLETRELWGEDGRLVAINQQTLAIIA